MNCNALAKRIEASGEHSASAESQSNFYMEEAFAYMVGTPEEVAKRFEEQAGVQQAQNKMLQTQQESFNNLKKMMAL